MCDFLINRFASSRVVETLLVLKHLIALKAYYEADCGRSSTDCQTHQCASIHWLVNSGAICSVLCLPDATCARNGRREPGTDNGNGIRQRGNGRQSDSLHLCECMWAFVCLCGCVASWSGARPAAHFLSAHPTCACVYLQPPTDKHSLCDKPLWTHRPHESSSRSSIHQETESY